MTSREGYDAYQLYLGIKLHFYSDYDFVKYNGKVRGDINAFLKRKDKYHFGKLFKLYGQNLQDFYVANLCVKDSYAVDLVNDETSVKVYKDWKKRNQKLSYLFEQEVSDLLLKFKIQTQLKVVDGQHPSLLRSFLAGDVSLETMCILDDITHFSDDWLKLINENIVYPDVHRRIQKYKTFISVDINSMKQKLLELCSQ